MNNRELGKLYKQLYQLHERLSGELECLDGILLEIERHLPDIVSDSDIADEEEE